MPALLGDPAADAYLRALASRAHASLGDRFVGAWLVNSGARDDYVPGSSDLDVTVAVTERLDRATGDAVADSLRHGRLRCPAPKLELVVYRREVLADPGPEPDWDLNLNTGPVMDDHVSMDPAAEPAHWFVLDLAMAREAAVPLSGPPLRTLLGPIPDAVIADALRASSAWYADNDGAGPNRVLNACRAWLWIEQRRWSSKTEAAAWAITAGGNRELITRAVGRRRGEASAPLPAAEVAAFIGAVEARLAGVSGDPE